MLSLTLPSKTKQLLSKITSRYPKLFTCTSGIAAGSVFTLGTPGWMLPIFLVPFISVLSSIKPIHFRDRLSVTASFFFPFHALVLSWFLDVNISGLIGMNSTISRFTAIFSWLLMTLITTLAMLLVVAAIPALKTQAIAFPAVLLAAVWVIAEWTRSLLFSIFLYGNGGSIGDYWNFGSLGLGLIDTPVGYLSRFIGMYGLTFLAVFFAVIFYKSWTLKRYTFMIAGIVMVAILSFVVSGLYDGSPGDPHKAASMLQNKSIMPDYGYGTVTENQSDTPKDLIVLPEYSRMFNPEYKEFADLYVNNRLADSGFSVSVSTGQQEKWYGTLEFRDKSGQIIETQTKQLLIPTGEYLPYIVQAFYKLTGQDEILNTFEKDRRVYKGSQPATFTSGDLTAGPVACSGILGRNIFRGLANNGAEVLTNSASLIDFQYSKTYLKQSLQMARFHAVANSRPFIQSTLGAPAFAMDHQGSYVVRPGDSNTKLIDFSFQPRSQKTLYTLIGEWVLLASGLLILATLIKKQIRKK